MYAINDINAIINMDITRFAHSKKHFIQWFVFSIAYEALFRYEQNDARDTYKIMNTQILKTLCRLHFRRIDNRTLCLMNIFHSSGRTAALWSYILVSNHNASDPVVQKSFNLRRIFFCAP
jgi:hypothetical protein